MPHSMDFVKNRLSKSNFRFTARVEYCMHFLTSTDRNSLFLYFSIIFYLLNTDLVTDYIFDLVTRKLRAIMYRVAQSNFSPSQFYNPHSFYFLLPLVCSF